MASVKNAADVNIEEEITVRIHTTRLELLKLGNGMDCY
jgi:hypothetical protein